MVVEGLEVVGGAGSEGIGEFVQGLPVLEFFGEGAVELEAGYPGAGGKSRFYK